MLFKKLEKSKIGIRLRLLIKRKIRIRIKMFRIRNSVTKHLQTNVGFFFQFFLFKKIYL